MMPISTPPNAIVFGSGLVPVSKMLKTGLLLNITGALIIFFRVMVYIKFL